MRKKEVLREARYRIWKRIQISRIDRAAIYKRLHLPAEMGLSTPGQWTSVPGLVTLVRETRGSEAENFQISSSTSFYSSSKYKES